MKRRDILKLGAAAFAVPATTFLMACAARPELHWLSSHPSGGGGVSREAEAHS
jgi:hypothetical protein